MLVFGVAVLPVGGGADGAVSIEGGEVSVADTCATGGVGWGDGWRGAAALAGGVSSALERCDGVGLAVVSGDEAHEDAKLASKAREQSEFVSLSISAE